MKFKKHLNDPLVAKKLDVTRMNDQLVFEFFYGERERWKVEFLAPDVHIYSILWSPSGHERTTRDTAGHT